MKFRWSCRKCKSTISVRAEELAGKRRQVLLCPLCSSAQEFLRSGPGLEWKLGETQAIDRAELGRRGALARWKKTHERLRSEGRLGWK